MAENPSPKNNLLRRKSEPRFRDPEPHPESLASANEMKTAQMLFDNRLVAANDMEWGMTAQAMQSARQTLATFNHEQSTDRKRKFLSTANQLFHSSALPQNQRDGLQKLVQQFVEYTPQQRLNYIEDLLKHTGQSKTYLDRFRGGHRKKAEKGWQEVLAFHFVVKAVNDLDEGESSKHHGHDSRASKYADNASHNYMVNSTMHEQQRKTQRGSNHIGSAAYYFGQPGKVEDILKNKEARSLVAGPSTLPLGETFARLGLIRDDQGKKLPLAEALPAVEAQQIFKAVKRLHMLNQPFIQLHHVPENAPAEQRRSAISASLQNLIEQTEPFSRIPDHQLSSMPNALSTPLTQLRAMRAVASGVTHEMASAMQHKLAKASPEDLENIQNNLKEYGQQVQALTLIALADAQKALELQGLSLKSIDRLHTYMQGFKQDMAVLGQNLRGSPHAGYFNVTDTPLQSAVSQLVDKCIEQTGPNPSLLREVSPWLNSKKLNVTLPRPIEPTAKPIEIKPLQATQLQQDTRTSETARAEADTLQRVKELN